MALEYREVQAFTYEANHERSGRHASLGMSATACKKSTEHWESGALADMMVGATRKERIELRAQLYYRLPLTRHHGALLVDP